MRLERVLILFSASFTMISAPVAYSQENKQNFDFAQSPCYAKARQFNKAYAQRVFVRFADYERLDMTDGATNWSQTFPALDTSKSMNFAAAGVFDAWAVYSALETKNGVVQGFAVQYLFGGIGSPKPECQVYPKVPERVSIDTMAPGAVHAYTTRLAGKPAGHLDEMRRDLKDFVKQR